MIRCKWCIRGYFFPRFIRIKAGGVFRLAKYPEFNFEYFKCKYCEAIIEGRLI